MAILKRIRRIPGYKQVTRSYKTLDAGSAGYTTKPNPAPIDRINNNEERTKMIKINNEDGKTQETAIVITDAENHREARMFYYNFLEEYLESNGYDSYKAEEVGDTLDQLIAVHRFYKNGEIVDELWIDYTIFFHKCDK